MNRWDLYVKFHAWRNRQAFEAYQAAVDQQHFDKLKRQEESWHSAQLPLSGKED